jgi:hypothetical protein
MRRNLLVGSSVLLAIVLLTVVGIQVQRNTDRKYLHYDHAFDAHLSAFTQGEITRVNPVTIVFAYDVATPEQIGVDLEESPFVFKPALKGVARFTDARTLVFTPENALPSGQIYKARLKMAKLVPGLSRDLREFYFHFASRPQRLQMEFTGMQTEYVDNHPVNRLTGEVKTADFEKAEVIEAIFKAQLGNKNLKVKWDHFPQENRHVFVIDSLDRTQDPYEVVVKWDGKKAGMKAAGEEKIVVPAIGKFAYAKTYVKRQPQALIVVEFTDPLRADQNLDGLIDIKGLEFRTAIEGNQVKIYPQGKPKGSFSVHVMPGVQGINGERLQTPAHTMVAFESAKPELKLVGKGVIMPKSNTLPFVFEAVGLRAVDVRIIKIFEQNIPQFLQVNQMDEYNELRRVGRQVLKKRIDLDAEGKLDLTDWNRHALDLSTLINPDPGAIYQVAIGFRRSYSLYACEGKADEDEEYDMLELNDDWSEPGYDSFWDYYYYWDEEGEDGEDHLGNPCEAQYYNKQRLVMRNVLASDLGLIAKQGDGGSLFTVTDLKTAAPLPNVNLEIYDYQHQLVKKATTDAQGMARLSFDRKPFLLVAKHGEQRGYLRLDDGSALSLSEFDIAGQEKKKGLAGYVYGERGVWRPGDDMHLTFVLEDKLKTLPLGHPMNFELVDSRGRTIQKETSTTGVNGFYRFTGKTDAAAPTGNYLARFKVGGASFTKTLKVETIMPNRLKVELDFGKDFLKATGTAPNATLRSRWLHGAPAKSLKADVAVQLNPRKTTFKGYENYLFDDPTRKFQSEEQTLFEGKLSETGEVVFPAKFPASNGAPGSLNANFRVRVFEPGGNFSTDRFSMPLYPYDNYVGVSLPQGDARNMLLTDQDHQIKIVTVDAAGKPVSRSGLKVTVYKLNWRWWWDRSEENFTDYKGKIEAEEIQSSTVNTVNGSATWKFRINQPEWGRYLIRVVDASGHATGAIAYVDWPGWAGRARGEDQEAATMLSLSKDKEKYTVGEQVTLNFPTGFAGRALITIESGTKVLQAHWVDAKAGGAQFKFPATPDMAPNVYAYVTLVQPHAQTSNDLPIRMYGVTPIMVEDPATHLEPVITMSESLEPMSKFTVKVGEKKGGPMTYTLAIVDEGLLDLTRFKTPDPWNHFYQRQALQVRSWDLFDQVIGAYGGELKSILSVGGSDEGLTGPGPKANRFKPVVIFAGPFELKAGEVKGHEFEMPNYVGSVKVMVVAGNATGGYGSAEKVAAVKKPLMVLATLPRVLGPGESVRLPVSVFAMDPAIQSVTLKATAKNGLMVDGSETQTVKFTSIGDKMATFNLSVLQTGTGSVTITATSGSYSATYSTDIEVRNPNPRITNVANQVVAAGAEWKGNVSMPGTPGSNMGVLEVSSIPPINLGQRLKYLIQYPYGCVEQITSGAFPQLYLSKVTEMPPAYSDRVQMNVQAAISKLKNFQVAGGGLSYWPGEGYANDWATNYVGHFFIEAEKAGYNLPPNFMANWQKYQAQKAREWTKGERPDQMTQAYRLYLLALSGKADMGSMNRMRQLNLYGPAKYLLAAAYGLAGQEKTAAQIVEGVATTAPSYREMAETFGSATRDQAIVLMSLNALNRKEQAFSLVSALSERLSSDRWLSTQETAFSLMAISQYLEKSPAPKDVTFEYRVGTGAWVKAKPGSAVFQTDLGKVSGGVEFKNTSKGPLYARYLVDGIPATGDTSTVNSGIRMAVRFTTLDNKPLIPRKLEQGTDFVAVVTVTGSTSQAVKNLALMQIFPSGWEIHNSRLDAFGDTGDSPTYQDIRDDRVHTFFDLKAGETKTFKVMLNASYLGRFYLPAFTVEAMYDRAFNARTGGSWVDVVEPGNS